MLKKLLGAIIITSEVSTTAYSCNWKLLDLESDACVSKIWSGIKLPKSKIKESLNFLDDKDTEESSNVQVIDFKSFYEKITKNVQEKKLLEFAEECKNIFEEEKSSKNKFSVKLLLENVFSKYTSFLKKAESLKRKDDKIQSNEDITKSSIFKAFLNADKSIKF